MGKFRPGFIVYETGYDQPTSGGQSTGGAGDPEETYYDPVNDLYYYYHDGAWYYFGDSTGGEDVYYGPTLDPEAMGLIKP